MPAAATVAPIAPPQAHWERGTEGEWVLHLAGDWSAGGKVPPPPAEADAAARVHVDARALAAWTSRLASTLWPPLAALSRRGARVRLDGLPRALQQLLALALPAKTPPPPPAAATSRLERIGARSAAWWADALVTLSFVGEVLVAAARALRGRTDMRRADLAWQLEQTGPRSIPIVTLVAAMVGLIVAYMGAAQLQRFGARSYIADLMEVAVVRELAALVTGIILTGRIGAAFAAQLGSMRANDEIDALRTVDIDPVSHLVLPRVLALVAVAPLLTAYAALVGLAVGWVTASGLFGVGAHEYLARTLETMSLGHIGVGLSKGVVYGALVALAGCREGLHSGRSAQAVGEAVTQAVVKGVLWIVIGASVLTVMYQRLGV